MDRLSKLGITLYELYGFLKDADYDEYCRTRDGAFKRLTRVTSISKPTFAVFWHGLMVKLDKQYGFVKPNSTNSNAIYHRSYRGNKKQRDALRLEQIRIKEKRKEQIRAMSHNANLESLEELENRIGYLTLGEDLKT